MRQGESQEQAILNVKEAIDLYTETLVAENQPVPEETFGAMLVAV